jgi:DNA mismatch repair protein MutS
LKFDLFSTYILLSVFLTHIDLMNKKKSGGSTPLMDQYLKIKAQHADSILLYRMGDFYETFFEDAQIISKTLGIALTKRAHGKSANVPLAGFPYHALDTYLPKLVQAGHRVAICEQIEDPKMAKGVVKRNVIEIVTPGATLSEKLLDHKKNNFLAAIYFDDAECGLCFCDISTGEFYICEIHSDNLWEQLSSFNPREILINKSEIDRVKRYLRDFPETVLTPREEWMFSFERSEEILKTHFAVHSLKGFGSEKLRSAITAAGVVMGYLKENYTSSLEHVQQIRVLNLSDYMILDEATRRNLEIQNPLRENIGGNTLLEVLDKTQTAMGGRLLRKWLLQPLKNIETINLRLDLTQELIENLEQSDKLEEFLAEISDMERLIGKIVTAKANGRDFLNLKQSLSVLPKIQAVLTEDAVPKLCVTFGSLDSIPELISLISSAIADDPPPTITEGGVIRSGYDKTLDDLKNIAHHGKKWLASLQQEERNRTGISNLKINYNKVFGYYLEISRSNLDKIPEDYIRKQTLVNAERFITPKLKEEEEKILGAEEKLKALEYELFQKIRLKIASYTARIQESGELVAFLDCVHSLSRAAIENHYIRPLIELKPILRIKSGRHPVVEKFMKPGDVFVPNDVSLQPDDEQIWIITGPNMAGKSTFLRQVGLIVFMAQIGSYVPADEASIGIVDRIFTRVGASDNLASGESTFLIEMNETANILNNATDHSLVLLDEIGRGTSTFDGLAIAWAVSEFLHREEGVKAKTLFATHYHELTELAILYPRIKNYNVAVEEWEDEIIFLRKIVPGGTDNSYGIHVAQMAGLPQPVIERAREILSNLEANELSPNRMPRLAHRRSGREVDRNQLSLFKAPKSSRIEKTIKQIDINKMTPVDALVTLNELKKIVDQDS